MLKQTALDKKGLTKTNKEKNKAKRKKHERRGEERGLSTLTCFHKAVLLLCKWCANQTKMLLNMVADKSFNGRQEWVTNITNIRSCVQAQRHWLHSSNKDVGLSPQTASPYLSHNKPLKEQSALVLRARLNITQTHHRPHRHNIWRYSYSWSAKPCLVLL